MFNDMMIQLYKYIIQVEASFFIDFGIDPIQFQEKMSILDFQIYTKILEKKYNDKQKERGKLINDIMKSVKNLFKSFVPHIGFNSFKP